MINLSQKQTKAWDFLEDKKTNEVFYGGAAGGGKSFLGCLWHIHRRVTYAGSRGLIGRAVLKNLKGSTLVTFFDVAKSMGYTINQDFKYNSQTSVIAWVNGSKTILKDLYLYPKDPDFTSLGSTEFTDAFIDEGTELELKAFEILNSRIRYKLDQFGLVPKVYITGNPSPGWVKERYVMRDGKSVHLLPNQRFISATVFDNPDKQFVETYSRQLQLLTNDYDRQRLLYGDWDAEREIERPFAHAYNETKHVKPLENPINSQAYVLIDFNIDPFCANLFNVWKENGVQHCQQFNEIEIHKGSIDEMALRIKSILGSRLNSCFIGGDAMGKNRTIGNIDNKSLFQRLLESLKVSRSQLKIAANPGHSTSREDVNYFLEHYPNFTIADNCQGTRRDMRTVQVDLYGSIIKRNRSDLSQRADFLDNVRYMINTFFKTEINYHRKTGLWH